MSTFITALCVFTAVTATSGSTALNTNYLGAGSETADLAVLAGGQAIESDDAAWVLEAVALGLFAAALFVAGNQAASSPHQQQQQQQQQAVGGSYGGYGGGGGCTNVSDGDFGSTNLEPAPCEEPLGANS